MSSQKEESVELDPCIEIEAFNQMKMLPDTIQLANHVVSKLGDMDPALVTQMGDANTVHTCAGLAGCPFPQGATPQHSLTTFKTWLVATALATPGVTVANQLVGVHGSAWYNITDDAANEMVYSRLQVIPWVANILLSPHNGDNSHKCTGLWALGQPEREHLLHAMFLDDFHFE